MTFGVKTNERPGTRATARHIRMSAYKAREVLDLIRGKHVVEANEILQFVERDAAIAISKVLASAIANAVANDDQDAERLEVSACYADEGPTMKRWRPRARGRATQIRKRTCHITVIVSRMSDEDLERRNARATSASAGSGRKASARASESRAARVAQSRARDAAKAGLDEDADDIVDAEVADGPTGEADVEVVGIPSEPTDDEPTTDAATTDAATTDDAGEGEADDSGEAAESARRSSADDGTEIAEGGDAEGIAKEND